MSGEVTLGAILTIITMLVSAISVGAGCFVWIGRLQQLLEQVIKDAEKVRQELAQHNKDDQNTFRQIEATLNQIVGQLHVVGQLHMPRQNT